MDVQRFDVVILGGGPGGYTAALAVKHVHPDVSVLLVRREELTLYPGAIPYLSATMESFNRNLLPDDTLKNAGVEILIDEARDLDLDGNAVSMKTGGRISYRKLILATGSSPVVPRSIAGTELEGVHAVQKSFTLMRKLEDDLQEAGRVVIIGGGFVGAEFADDLARTKKDVTIVELLPHCLILSFDEEFAVEAEEKLRSEGVKILTNARVTRILGEGRVNAVELADGRRLGADIVILGLGARPEVELARRAGLAIGETGGVVVDEYMRASHPDVLAVGDCAEKRSFFTGKPVPFMLASVACQEARVAGLNLFGIRVPRAVQGVVGVILTRIAGRALGAAGLTESMAEKESFQVVSARAKVLNKDPGVVP